MQFSDSESTALWRYTNVYYYCHHYYYHYCVFL